MSRIGKLPIHVPAGVTVTIKDSVVTVKGPKGEMTQAVNPDINVTLEDGVIHLARPTDDKNHRALHGLYRSLINNYWVRFVLRFVHSECRNRIKVRVLSLWVRKFAESLVNQQVSNLRKLKLS